MSASNAIFGLAFVAFLFLPGHSAALGAFAVFFGFWLNVATVCVGAVLALMLPVQLIRGQALSFSRRHWLGFFNCGFIILFWLAFGYLDSKHAFASWL